MPHRSGSRRTRTDLYVPLIHETTTERRKQSEDPDNSLLQDQELLAAEPVQYPANLIPKGSSQQTGTTRRKHGEHLSGNERQDLNAGTEPPVILASNSMLATTHVERPVKPQADRQRHEGTRCGQVTRAHALPAPHFAQRLTSVAVSSQSTKLDTIAYEACKPLSIDKFVQQRLNGQVMQFLDPSVVPP